MAATAALLDRKPDKAQLYLKRYAKRYVASKPYFLLSALALAAEKKLIAARALLERHGLTDWRIAMGVFPGGWERRGWLAAAARRRHGSRGPDPRTPSRNQGGSPSGALQELLRPDPPRRRRHKRGRLLGRQCRPSSAERSEFLWSSTRT